MNITSTPKINFYKSTAIPSSSPTSGGKPTLSTSSFLGLDPDIINQQRTRTKAGFREPVKSGAKALAFGAGYTTAVLENTVKGMVASIFRKQAERNKQRELKQSRQKNVGLAPLVAIGGSLVKAVNGVGSVFNGIASSLSKLFKIESDRYKLEKDARVRSFKSLFDTVDKLKTAGGGLMDVLFRTGGSFWEAIIGLLSGLLKYLFIRPLLEWLADPANREKIIGILETFKKVFDVVYKFTKDRITGLIDGLYSLLKDDATWQERFVGLFKTLGNLGLLLLGIRWLTNPFKIIGDLKAVLGGFYGALKLFGAFLKTPFRLIGGALIGKTALGTATRLGIAGVAGVAGYAAYQNNKESVDAAVSDAYSNVTEFAGEQLENVKQFGQTQMTNVQRMFSGQERQQQLASPQITPIGENEEGGVERYVQDYLNQFSERLGLTETQVEGVNTGAGYLFEDLSGMFSEQLDTSKGFVKSLNETLDGVGVNLPERSMGGVVKLSNLARGGFIQGPKSGYPVSLDGGKSPSFIGHGTEYVSKKNDGSAFVVPLDTPHTDKDPNLIVKRTQEALKGGYKLDEFSQGGSFESAARKYSNNPKDFALDPTIAQSVPLLYRMLQSGRFAKKGWGNRDFLNNLTGQILHETAGGTRARELYNTSPSDPKGKPGYQYFSGYSGMLGNRNADDAYQFRGRGPLQLTGRSHYQGFNTWLQRNGYRDYDVLSNPSLIENDPKVQALSTLYYLEDREKTFPNTNFAATAAKGDVRGFTYNINGGYNHLNDRIRATNIASQSNINYGTGFKPAVQTKPAPQPQSPFGGFFSRFGFSDGGEVTDTRLFGYKSGGYLPKMDGPQIRMDSGPHNMQYAPSGGWITGPITGYPVSVKGKSSPDFIAHGTEYIAKKPTGEYRVLPYHGRGGKLEDLTIAGAALEGFRVPQHAPTKAAFERPSAEIGSVSPGVSGFFSLGGLFEGIKNIFGGGGDKKEGGGGGGFLSNVIGSIGNIVGGLFGGGNNQQQAGPTAGGDAFGQGISIFTNPQFGIDGGDVFGQQEQGGGGSIWENLAGSITSAIGGGGGAPAAQKPGYVTIQDQARAMGNQWGFQYDENGNIRTETIIPGLMRQAGGLGKEIGMMIGGKKGGQLGGHVGNALFTIFGGGGSGENGAATFNDIMNSAGQLAGYLFKDKKGLLGDIGDYSNIFFGEGADRFTFGEKVALALSHGLRGSPFGKYVRPISQALGVNVNNAIAWAKELNGEGLAGPGSDQVAAAADVGGHGPVPGGENGDGSDVGMEGGGIEAAVRGGKLALSQGFSVFNHPNFRNNKWSEFGANTGKGYSAGGGEKVEGGGLHAKGLGIDVGDYRMPGSESRLTSLADQMFTYKQDRKIVQIVYDNWGTWTLGNKREGPGQYGYPDRLHIGFAMKEPPASGSSLGPVTGGIDELQAGAIGQAVANTAPSNANIVEKAGIANAITNQAQANNSDLSSVLGDYGVDTQSYMNQFDMTKLNQMYQNTDVWKMDLTDFGKSMGLDVADINQYMPLAGDPEKLYNYATKVGFPSGEAENLVNATKVWNVGSGLKFSSKDTPGYQPQKVVIPQPKGGGGGAAPNHSLTDSEKLLGRDPGNRASGPEVASTSPSDTSKGIVKFPFYAPDTQTPGAPDAPQQAGMEAVSPSGGAGAGGGGGMKMPPPAGGKAALNEQGPDAGSENNLVSKAQTEASGGNSGKYAQEYAHKERAYGQAKLQEQGGQSVQNAIAQVEAINQQVRAAVADAQQRVQQLIASSNSGGGGGVGEAAKMGTSQHNGRAA